MGMNSIGTDVIRRLKDGAILNCVKFPEAKGAVEEVVEAAEKEIKELNVSVESYRASVNNANTKLAEANKALDTEKAMNSYKETQNNVKIQNLKDELKKQARAKKTGKAKVNKDGNLETREINSIGTTKVTEMLNDGSNRVVSEKFETINGNIVRRYYDPATGEKIKVYRNTNGHETLTDIKNGKKTVNELGKKVPKTKPKKVSTTEIKPNEYKETFSDGSYNEIVYSPVLQQETSIKSFDSKGKLVEKMERSPDQYGTKVAYESIKKYKQDGDKRRVYEVVSKNFAKNTESKFKYNENNVATQITRKTDKCTTYMDFTSKYGGVEGYAKVAKRKFPKDSPIKKSTVYYRADFVPEKEVFIMKDGRKVTLESIDGWYNPGSITIEKNGNIEKLTNYKQIEEYTKDMGFNDLKNVDSYYDNSAQKYYANDFII